MSRWRVTRLVARREIAERVRGRLIRIMTALTALLVVAGIVVPGLVKGSSSPARIGLVGSQAQALAPALQRAARAARVKVLLSESTSAAAARARILDGRLDVALSVAPSIARAEVKESLSATIRGLLTAVIGAEHLRGALTRAGVAPAAIAGALTPVPVVSTALRPTPADRPARYVAAIAAALLMYTSLAVYGGAVAGGVAQEKTSRTAEVLLGAIRPRELLTGKVTGIAVVGLGQLGIAALAGLIANGLVHSTKIPNSVWALLPSFLVLFLAGFVLYAFAFAAAGALVARQEEVQFVTLPISLPLLVGYVLVYAAVASPNATWLRVASLLPPLTPSLMPARIALGHIAWWEPPLAALIMAAAIYVVVRISARVYAGALISSGARLTWRGALRLRGGR